MILGYNTNGFAHHRLSDAVDILADIGYGSIALTLDVHHLNPFDDRWTETADALRDRCQRRGLRITVETGSRFLLDSRRKHQPTLISQEADGRSRRIGFLKRAIEIADRLGADSVSLWSGVATDDVADEVLFDRLCTGLRSALEHAERNNMRLAFEPEPGMYIETMSQFDRLRESIDHPLFGLTLDIGHVHCLGDGELSDHLDRHAAHLFNVHLEDMRRGLHDHLMFGDGDIDFERVIGAFRASDYRGPLHVELSRHSHDAVVSARRAYEFLAARWNSGPPSIDR